MHREPSAARFRTIFNEQTTVERCEGGRNTEMYGGNL